MEETIIIYTKYFSEAVIEVIDQYDLNIQIMCFSSYDEVLKAVETTPNLRGVIFLEHKPKRSTFKAYKKILETADEIAESSRQPFCISIISNTDLPRRFLSQIDTKHLEILFTKFLMFNTDLLRYEGIAAVITHTIGVANETILLELEREDEGIRSGASAGNVEFLRYCMQIATVDLNELDQFRDLTARYPSLDKLLYLRTHSDYDEQTLEESKNLFKVFAQQCIARRMEDEASHLISH